MVDKKNSFSGSICGGYAVESEWDVLNFQFWDDAVFSYETGKRKLPRWDEMNKLWITVWTNTVCHFMSGLDRNIWIKDGWSNMRSQNRRRIGGVSSRVASCKSASASETETCQQHSAWKWRRFQWVTSAGPTIRTRKQQQSAGDEEIIVAAAATDDSVLQQAQRTDSVSIESIRIQKKLKCCSPLPISGRVKPRGESEKKSRKKTRLQTQHNECSSGKYCRSPFEMLFRFVLLWNGKRKHSMLTVHVVIRGRRVTGSYFSCPADWRRKWKKNPRDDKVRFVSRFLVEISLSFFLQSRC